MRGRRRKRREAVTEAQRAVQCTGSCGRVFGGRGAFDQAHDARRPDPCLPVSAIESLLTEIRGTWYSRGSEPR